MSERVHPQTQSFRALFPIPGSSPGLESRLASCLHEIWCTVHAARRVAAQLSDGRALDHARLAEALDLVLTKAVTLQADSAAVVHNDGRSYTITDADDCICEDAQHRTKYCKHLLAVLIQRHATALREGTAPAPASSPAPGARPPAVPLTATASAPVVASSGLASATWPVAEAPEGDGLDAPVPANLMPGLIGLSAVAPPYNHDEAERGGSDYACEVFAHFDPDLAIPLGTIPYPDEHGEFVLHGHRYSVPMYLRDSSGAVPAERKTATLRVVFIGDLLEERVRRVLAWALQNVAADLQVVPVKTEDKKAHTLALGALLRTYLGKSLEGSTRRLLLRSAGRLVDQQNPLGRLCQRNELSFYGPRGIHPESVGHLHLRDVNEADLSRICPVQTPQGHAVGLRLSLARRARVDHAKQALLPPTAPQAGDSLGDAASLIPFVEHDDVVRALMGANMLKQTLALERPQAPWVQTGWEQELATRPEVSEVFKAHGVLALGANLLVGYLPWGLDTFEDGIVASQSAAVALTSVQEETFWLDLERQWLEEGYQVMEITADNLDLTENGDVFQKLDERGIVKVGQEVGPGEVLVSAVLKRSTPVHKTQVLDSLRGTPFSDEALAETRDRSLRLPHNFRGRVVAILDSEQPGAFPMALPPRVTRRIGVRVRRIELLVVGDKLTGRHGNKGVVVRLLPDREMPYLKTQEQHCTDEQCRVCGPHRHLQVLLNPLGVLGRLNVGQLYETALAKVAEARGKPYVVAPFVDKWTPERLARELSNTGFAPDGKEQLYIVEGAAERPLRYQSLVGPQYLLRLHHLAWEKVHGRAGGRVGDYTLRDDQPRAGKRSGGGQRVGEMETWALAGHGAWHLLDDCLTVKSDDRELRRVASDDPVNWDGKRRPRALVNLILAVRGLGLDMRLWNAEEQDVTQAFLAQSRGVEFHGLTLDLAPPEMRQRWELHGEVCSLKLYSAKASGPELGPDQEGLLSRTIFEKSWHMGCITLAHPIVHPLAARRLWPMFHFPNRFKKSASWGWATELLDLLNERQEWPAERKGALKGRKEVPRRPSDYCLFCLPVVPTSFRRERLGRVHDFQHNLNLLYLDVLIANAGLRVLIDNHAPALILKDGRERLFQTVNRLFFGGSRRGGERLQGLLDVLAGKTGLLRGHLAGKRVDFSGRAVIVGDSTVALDEVRLPSTLWSALFPRQTSVDEKGQIVLLNRQPSLHRYSFQAFYASPHQDGDVIRINPFVCKPFNADFDGDTIAVHVPRKPQARSEATKLLPSGNLFSQANGGLVLGFSGDIALGAVYLSHHPDIQSGDEVPFTDESACPLHGHDFWEERVVGGVRTTVGRLLLRRVFASVSIPNRRLDVKDDTWQEVLEAVARQEPEVFKRFTNDISQLLAGVLRESGWSLSVADFATLGKNFDAVLDTEATTLTPHFLWVVRQAKAKGDLTHLVGPRGAMRRPGTEKKTRPIASGLVEGHTEAEYLRSAHGARTGLVDKGLNTAPAGLLLRRLIYALQGVYIVTEDCGVSEGGKGGRGLHHRSPYTCRASDRSGRWGICQKCYRSDPSTGKLPEIGLPVGLLAAQAIGERASQLTLRTFHTGGGIQKSLDLDLLRDRLFKSKITTEQDAARWIREMMTLFKDLSDRPLQVHFEIIVRGLKDKEASDRDFLAKWTYSGVGANLLFGAARRAEDPLWGVISRIVAGRLVGTGPQKESISEARTISEADPTPVPDYAATVHDIPTLPPARTSKTGREPGA